MDWNYRYLFQEIFKDDLDVISRTFNEDETFQVDQEYFKMAKKFRIT